MLTHLHLLVVLCLLAGACRQQVHTPSKDEVNFSYTRQNFGASAGDLLTARRFTSLLVEVQYMRGYKPNEAALLNLKLFLQQHLHKPEGIYFIQEEIPPVADTVLTSAQVDSIQKVNRKIFNQGSRFALYILYTNGHYENMRVLGHAFLNSCIVIYGRTIKANEGVFSIPDQTTIESTLLTHEIGHLLGLVNTGTAMQEAHTDTAHEQHCKNPDCVMYWSMSVQPEFGPLMQRGIPCLDSACMRDLILKGGR